MYGLFKFIMITGAVAGVAGFLWPQFGDHPSLQGLPPETQTYLSFGGLGLVILGLIGRSATRPPETVTWE